MSDIFGLKLLSHGGSSIQHNVSELFHYFSSWYVKLALAACPSGTKSLYNIELNNKEIIFKVININKKSSGGELLGK